MFFHRVLELLNCDELFAICASGIIFAIPPSHNGSEFLIIRAESDECVKVYLRVGRIHQFFRHYFYPWLQNKYGPRQRLAIAKVCYVTANRWHRLNIEKTSTYLTVNLDGKLGAGLRLVSIISFL